MSPRAALVLVLSACGGASVDTDDPADVDSDTDPGTEASRCPSVTGGFYTGGTVPSVST